MESTLYFALCEALTNAVKHARADSITLAVRPGADVIVAEVRDDGVGGAGHVAARRAGRPHRPRPRAPRPRRGGEPARQGHHGPHHPPRPRRGGPGPPPGGPALAVATRTPGRRRRQAGVLRTIGSR
ncbi:ATP-binding protein [Actinomadura madurae]|uniref:ATP-binding protein n=1 Tax=Actinomadura madurae TaxID=1993 RepID=UPI003556E244